MGIREAVKVAVAAQEGEKVLPTLRYTSIVVLDDYDDADLCPHIVEERRFWKATADFGAGFKVEYAAQK